MASNEQDQLGDLFQPLQHERVSSRIADELAEAISSGRLKPGDRLPPERDLLVRYGVSRNTVREAARILEMAGLVKIRQGAAGGVFVTKPDFSIINRSLKWALRANHLDVGEVYEAREAVEPEIARLAALRRDDGDLATIRELLTNPRMVSRETVERVTASHDFHIALANASKNRSLLIIVTSLLDLADVQERRIGLQRASFAIFRTHQAIFDAVERGDASLAEKLTREHLAVLKQEATGQLPESSEDAPPIRTGASSASD